MIRHGIELDSETIRDFCRRWKIKELSVFGSILRDDFRPDSDIDFLAVFEDDAEWDLFDDLHMRDELATILRRKVEIIDRLAVETGGNRFVLKEVLSTAEHIYAAG